MSRLRRSEGDIVSVDHYDGQRLIETKEGIVDKVTASNFHVIYEDGTDGWCNHWDKAVTLIEAAKQETA